MDRYYVFLDAAFSAAMIVAAAIDSRWRIIPDWLSLGGMALALTASALAPGLNGGLIASATGAAAGLGSGILLYAGGGVLFRRQIAQAADPEIDCAFGMGDAKLMGFVGAYCGWRGVVFVYLVGTIVGALAGIWRKYRTGSAGNAVGRFSRLLARWRTGDAVLPFGPCIAAGAILYCLRNFLR